MIAQLKKYTILYAEDESIIRLNIGRQLKKHFKEVFLAKDGLEAMLLYQEKKPDALFLDIEMPEFSGLEVAKKIRASNDHIPIIMLTAYTHTSFLLDAVDLNITKYLLKPLQKQEFKDALQKIANTFLKIDEEIIQLKGDMLWNIEEKTLQHKEEEVLLTGKERILLHILLQNQNKCVTHETIMARVWEDDFEQEITFDSVKNLVKNLRKKFQENNIRSVYGKGYIFN